MIHAPRGIGKTHVALGTAWAVAAGGGFLRWTTPGGAFRVVVFDGEMPGILLQERLKRVVTASGLAPPLPEYLRIAAADVRRDGLPDLADPTSHQFYADVIGDADLVVIDNLSTICRGLCGFRRLRPGKPIERGHAFRSKAATFSDEGDRARLPA